MATLRGKDSPLRIFFRRAGTVALLFAVVGIFLSVRDVYRKERESRQLRDQAELQRADLAQQSARLQNDIAVLKTDRGKEEALREQYELGKTGEGLIVIVDPQTPKPVAATSTFMQKVKNFFIFW